MFWSLRFPTATPRTVKSVFRLLHVRKAALLVRGVQLFMAASLYRSFISYFANSATNQLQKSGGHDGEFAKPGTRLLPPPMHYYRLIKTLETRASGYLSSKQQPASATGPLNHLCDNCFYTDHRALNVLGGGTPFLPARP
jgi:hypothetical protein